MNTDRVRADFKDAFRNSAKRPWFWLTATICLALGLGVNASLFAVVRGVLLKPLPYPKPEELVVATRIVYRKPETPTKRWGVLGEHFLDWRGSSSNSFEGLVAVGARRSLNLTAADRPRVVEVRGVSSGFFSLLGARMIAGRAFLPEDERAGAYVAVVGEGLARRAFGQPENAVGQEMRLDGQTRQVVGVVSKDFTFLYERVDSWIPLVAESPKGYLAEQVTVLGRLSELDGREAAVAYSNSSPSACLHHHSRSSGRQRFFSEGLIVVQIAVAVTLLIGAGLMLKTFIGLSRISLGFNPDRLLLVTVRLSRTDYTEYSQEANGPGRQPETDRSCKRDTRANSSLARRTERRRCNRSRDSGCSYGEDGGEWRRRFRRHSILLSGCRSSLLSVFGNPPSAGSLIHKQRC